LFNFNIESFNFFSCFYKIKKMKPILRNALILISPFLLMILVNETMRPFINSKSISYQNVSCINSNESNKNFCSWACLNTEYCNANHSKILKHKELDPVYLGIISALKKGGYVLMNIIFLVMLIPFCIWFFTIKALNIQDKINNFKKEQNP
jgi:hypothetical protein